MIGKNETRPLEELAGRYAAYRKEQTDLLERIDQLSKQICNMMDDRLRCAEAGETEKYRALADEIQKLEDEKYVSEKRLAKLQSTPPFSMDEVRSAWTKYHDKYSASFSAKLDKFKKAKNDFLTLYGELIEEQAESLKIRKELLSYMGKAYENKPADFFLPMTRIPADFKHEKGISLHLANIPCKDTDFLFFYHAYLQEHFDINYPYSTNPEAFRRFMTILGAPQIF